MAGTSRRTTDTFAPRVLVVNASPESRIEIASLLSRARFDVVTCATGAEGFAMFKLEPSSALVVDYQLPDMGGIDFVQRCARTGLLSATIMTTKKGDIPTAVEAFREGISDFFPEPFDQRLAQSLRHVLGKADGENNSGNDGDDK